MQYVDTNIVLRYLLDDDKQQSPLAKEIIESGEAELPIEVLPEVVYVLQGPYGLGRKQIAEAIIALLDNSGLLIERRVTVLKAMDYYATTKLDFIDSMLAARSIVEKAPIHTFDKKLRKLIEREQKD
jgi:predicted nucleic-acid-binding protein